MSNKLNQHNQKIDNKIKQLEKNIANLQAEAKDNLAKSQNSKGSAKDMYKQRCLMALKKKKQCENQMKNYFNHQMMIQQTNINAQSFQNQKQMFETMQNVVKEQKQAMKQIDLDKMDQLQQQMREMKFQAEYMNQMMNRNYDVDVDEDQLDDQLMEFEKQIKRQVKKQSAGKNVQIQGQMKNKDQFDFLNL